MVAVLPGARSIFNPLTSPLPRSCPPLPTTADWIQQSVSLRSMVVIVAFLFPSAGSIGGPELPRSEHGNVDYIHSLARLRLRLRFSRFPRGEEMSRLLGVFYASSLISTFFGCVCVVERYLHTAEKNYYLIYLLSPK